MDDLAAMPSTSKATQDAFLAACVLQLYNSFKSSETRHIMTGVAHSNTSSPSVVTLASTKYSDTAQRHVENMKQDDSPTETDSDEYKRQGIYRDWGSILKEEMGEANYDLLKGVEQRYRERECETPAADFESEKAPLLEYAETSPVERLEEDALCSALPIKGLGILSIEDGTDEGDSRVYTVQDGEERPVTSSAGVRSSPSNKNDEGGSPASVETVVRSPRTRYESPNLEATQATLNFTSQGFTCLERSSSVSTIGDAEIGEAVISTARQVTIARVASPISVRHGGTATSAGTARFDRPEKEVVVIRNTDTGPRPGRTISPMSPRQSSIFSVTDTATIDTRRTSICSSTRAPWEGPLPSIYSALEGEPQGTTTSCTTATPPSGQLPFGKILVKSTVDVNPGFCPGAWEYRHSKDHLKGQCPRKIHLQCAHCGLLPSYSGPGQCSCGHWWSRRSWQFENHVPMEPSFSDLEATIAEQDEDWSGASTEIDHTGLSWLGGLSRKEHSSVHERRSCLVCWEHLGEWQPPMRLVDWCKHMELHEKAGICFDYQHVKANKETME